MPSYRYSTFSWHKQLWSCVFTHVVQQSFLGLSCGVKLRYTRWMTRLWAWSSCVRFGNGGYYVYTTPPIGLSRLLAQGPHASTQHRRNVPTACKSGKREQTKNKHLCVVPTANKLCQYVPEKQFQVTNPADINLSDNILHYNNL